MTRPKDVLQPRQAERILLKRENTRPSDIVYPTPNNLLGRPEFVEVVRAVDSALPFAHPDLRTLLAEFAYEGPLPAAAGTSRYANMPTLFENAIALYYGSRRRPIYIEEELFGTSDRMPGETAIGLLHGEFRDYLMTVYGSRSPNLRARISKDDISRVPLERMPVTPALREKDKVNRWRSMTEFPLDFDGIPFTTAENFFEHPSLENRWTEEVNATVSALSDGKAVFLIGPHGIGKSKAYPQELMRRLHGSKYRISYDLSQRDARAFDFDWLGRFLENQAEDAPYLGQEGGRVPEPNDQRVAILDEVNVRSHNRGNIKIGIKRLRAMGILPIFLVPQGYAEAREEFAQWAQVEGYAAIISPHKTLPLEPVSKFLSMCKVSGAVEALIDTPEGRALLNPGVFTNIARYLLPSQHGPARQIQDLEDLGEWLDEDTLDVFGELRVVEDPVRWSNLEALLLDKLATGRAILDLAERTGARRPVRNDSIREHIRIHSPHYASTDPLAYD